MHELSNNDYASGSTAIKSAMAHRFEAATPLSSTKTNIWVKEKGE